MKITFTYNGVKYSDYELMVAGNNYNWNSYTYALGKDEWGFLCNHDGAMKDSLSSVKPPKDSSLYIAQPCPLCNADIRKNYIIKRHPDTADYCVVSPTGNITYDYYNSYATVIVPQRKQIYCYINRNYAVTHSIVGHAQDCTLLDPNDFITIPEIITFYVCNLSEFHIKYINDEITKPIAYYESLDMDTGNKLDQDLLYLVYTVGMADRNDDNFEKLVLQLESLNQHDWRNYPGTMSLLFRYILNKRWNTYMYYAYSPTKLPKAVKQFAFRSVPEVGPKDMSPDDFEMSRRFLSQLLGLDGTIYATLDSTISKMKESNIRPELMDSFFDVAVRIAPKTTRNA